MCPTSNKPELHHTHGNGLLGDDLHLCKPFFITFTPPHVELMCHDLFNTMSCIFNYEINIKNTKLS